MLCKRANVRLQAAECSQLRTLLSHTPDVTLTRCRTVAVHRRWGGSLWATTTVAVESPTDLFVASHWLERSSSRFEVTLPVFSRADHSTSTNHFLCGFYLQFLLKACFKCPSAHPLVLIGPLPWRHTPRFCSDARSIQISQNIQACRKSSLQAAAGQVIWASLN